MHYCNVPLWKRILMNGLVTYTLCFFIIWRRHQRNCDYADYKLAQAVALQITEMQVPDQETRENVNTAGVILHMFMCCRRPNLMSNNERDGINALEKLNTQIWDDPTTERLQQSTSKMYDLHQELRLSEHYALERSWKHHQLLTASSKTGLSRNLEESAVIFADAVNPNYKDGPESDGCRLEKGYSRKTSWLKVLITNSQIIHRDLVVFEDILSEHHLWSLRINFLFQQYLWGEACSLLPPLDAMFSFDDGAKSQHLQHLVTHCGLQLIHPCHFESIWQRKSERKCGEPLTWDHLFEEEREYEFHDILEVVRKEKAPLALLNHVDLRELLQRKLLENGFIQTKDIKDDTQFIFK